MRAKLPSKEGFVERDGVKIHYEVYGEGPQTMVFLPPWSIVHSRVYKAQLPYFSERFRCIAFDGARQRQVGPARRMSPPTRWTTASADILAVMDATDAGKAILVGLSLGGMHACVLAAHHPERVKAAILAGTAAAIGPGYPAWRQSTSRPSAKGSKAGTSTTATTGSRTIPISPSTSCATSSPSRTRPSRSRTASNGPARPPAPCW